MAGAPFAPSSKTLTPWSSLPAPFVASCSQLPCPFFTMALVVVRFVLLLRSQGKAISGPIVAEWWPNHEKSVLDKSSVFN